MKQYNNNNFKKYKMANLIDHDELMMAMMLFSNFLHMDICYDIS